MNRYGVIINGYPYGFCDYVDRWTVSLLQAQMSLKKSDSELLNNKDNER